MNQVAKDMSKVYRNTPTDNLKKNLGRKMHERNQLYGKSNYWAKKERARLDHMIMQLEAEITSRKLQMLLFKGL